MNRKEKDNVSDIFDLLRSHQMGIRTRRIETAFGWEIILVKFEFEGKFYPFPSDKRIPSASLVEEKIWDFEKTLREIEEVKK